MSLIFKKKQISVLYYIEGLKKEWGGAYQYSLNLLEIIASRIDDVDIFLYSRKIDKNFIDIVEKYSNVHYELMNFNESLFARLNRKISKFVNALFELLNKSSSKNPKYPIAVFDYYLSKREIDIIHCPFQNYVKNKFKIPFITTMHDVQFLHFPEFFSSGLRVSLSIENKNAIDNSKAVIVSYTHIKNDISRYFAKAVEQIYVCPIEMTKHWIFYASDDDSILNKIPDDYLLYPAVTWPHKNHVRLIEAIKHYEMNHNENLSIVFTGHKTEHISYIEKIIDKLQVQSSIFFLGIVNENELFSLYKNSSAVVVPTLYEAGSYPLMEAILLDIPVICSNVTSLPEIIGHERFTFDPYVIERISDAIYSILHDEEYICENKVACQKAKDRLLSYDMARSIKEIYMDLI